MSNFQNLNEKILLSNLILIRWIAIFGQLSTILFVFLILKISLPFLPCLIIVLISVIINVFSFFLKKEKKYLSENEAFFFLVYDTSQLAILLYLTGGIYNPFALLLIAPLIISASFLKVGYSISLSVFSVIIVIFISFFYIPINWNENFTVPNLFTYGLILSLIISIIFIATYVYILANSARKISNALNQTQLALINQKKFSEIGSLAAAATHEFSTPLNTIFLIINDLKKDKNLDKSIQKEILLLESQTLRCKKILLNLSKNPQNLQDNFLKKTTISNIVKLNFDKFYKDKIDIKINFSDVNNSEKEPEIYFSDEIMYGLGNIIENSIQYAINIIDVYISWDKEYIKLVISDDGRGFSKEILDNIGNPFITDSNKEGSLGLGIFIAKNLIENVGGKIKFSNRSKKTGATGSLVELFILRNI